MICSCCGLEIIGSSHKTDNGQKIVCQNCWNNPDMFFPEKIAEDQRLSLISKMAKELGNNIDALEVNAIKMYQKGVEMYVGKMKVTDILNLYELDRFKEEELEGYQRERYEERTAQLVEYIEKSPLAVMPALLVGLRETAFIPVKEDVGVLKIPRIKGSIWIIDGQHRVGGFSKIREQFLFTKSLGISLFTDLMGYELPVVFIDSKNASEKIKPKKLEDSASLTPQDIEKTIFFIVNKTQRGISPSLKDALLYSIKTSGIEGLSIVDKEGWRILGAELAITLNCKEGSPLRAKINVSGQRNSGKPIQLNSFVSSLETLFKDKDFVNLTVESKVSFIEAYWSALRELIPEAFKTDTEICDSKEEFGRRFASNINDKNRKNKIKTSTEKYLLLTSLSIHTLHRLAKDILHTAIQRGITLDEALFYKQMLAPLRSFDWRAKSSPLSALGGMKGVSKAYDLLSEKIGQDKYKDPNTNRLEATKNKSLKTFSPETL